MLDDLTELPEGWEETTLSELGEWSSGGTPSRSHAEYYGGEIPWVKTGNLSDGLVTEIDETITPEGLAKSSAKIFPKDSLLIAMYGATIGKLGLLKEPAATNQACAGLLAKGITHELIPFAFYYLLNCRDDFREIGQGGAQPNISQTILKEFPIYLPPLNEQKRIVAKIEELRSHTQAARNTIAHIPKLLEQFRQSVLAAAFRGDLTAEWRSENPDVEPAEVLLETIQRKKSKKNPKIEERLPDPHDLPSEWSWAKLEDVCQSVSDGDHQAPPQIEAGIPFLVISNIRSGKLDFTDTRYVPNSYFKAIQSVRKPEKGDILYSVVGSYGIPVAVTTEEPFCFQRHIALLKLGDLINQNYLLSALQSGLIFDQATEVSTGTAQITVPLSGLRQIKVPIPPFLEQIEIANRISSYFKAIDRIEEQYQFIKIELDRLDRSILAKAFKGELVPQDPTDEPAIVLLERIRNDRASQTKPAKSKRTKNRE